ncbi:MAG: TIGR04282 family arsenosugar biosynthesis glycosyltransferase, partial [Gammaproteobacteria bacterium]|nr:TIGR04282 family arsenosugar biosynthesis glycosyltransferase [Gammaproteobacteria bacterium]
MADRLLVFARAPVAGAVKTRLQPALGAAGAAALHRRLLERTVATACAAGVAPVELWCAPDRSHPAFAELAGRGDVTLRNQPSGDLGRRMHDALHDVLDGAGRAVLVGCDCPALTGDDLRAAFAALDAHDVVLGPAEDGGYVLVGARRVARPLFDGVEWGGPRVLRQTRARLVALGWRWHELRTFWDVDRPADLPRLREVGL